MAIKHRWMYAYVKVRLMKQWNTSGCKVPVWPYNAAWQGWYLVCDGNGYGLYGFPLCVLYDVVVIPLVHMV